MSARRDGQHPVTERGSALALVPAGFLVLIILAALTVDSAVAFLGQRQLGDTLSAAANDAAGAAISNSSFYRSGAVIIDPTTAAQIVCQTVAAQGDGLHQIRLAIAVAGPVIGIRGSAEVGEVFGKALPGWHDREVSAVAVAVAAQGPTGAVPPPSDYRSVAC